MKRLVFATVLSIGIPMMLAGCLEMEDTASSEGSQVETWEPPTDGTWPGRAHPPLIGYEEEFIQESPYGPTFSFQVTGMPEFQDIERGKATMSQRLLVTRLSDTNSLDPAWPKLHAGLDEEYEGTYPEIADATFTCESDIPNIGDSTTCVISARTDTDYVRNSYWSLHVDEFAAWPSQHSQPRE